jgi:AraC family transcriptional regulator, dual regulator of chb operon
MKARRVLFRDFVQPDHAYHGHLRTIPSVSMPNIRPHCHDFFEWTVVLDGEALHVMNGTKTRLRKGQLLLVRPDDVHSVDTEAGGAITYVNVCFPTSAWNDFAQASGITEWARAWESGAMPISVDLPSDRRQLIENEAMRAVRTYHRSPTRLALCQFLSVAAQAVLDAHPNSLIPPPPWLSHALDQTHSVDISDLSLETLTTLSGVSFGHLCHTMKKCIGVTPTQYINQIRIDRASYELAATDKEIVRIAFDCGFENLSYFYLRFRQVHNKSPRRYRQEAKRALLI